MLAFLSPSETGTRGAECLDFALTSALCSELRRTRVHHKLDFLLVGLWCELVVVVLVGQLRSFAWHWAVCGWGWNTLHQGLEDWAEATAAKGSQPGGLTLRVSCANEVSWLPFKSKNLRIFFLICFQWLFYYNSWEADSKVSCPRFKSSLCT